MWQCNTEFEVGIDKVGIDKVGITHLILRKGSGHNQDQHYGKSCSQTIFCVRYVSSFAAISLRMKASKLLQLGLQWFFLQGL